MSVAFAICCLALLFNLLIAYGGSDRVKEGEDIHRVAATVAMAWINGAALGLIAVVLAMAKWGVS